MKNLPVCPLNHSVAALNHSVAVLNHSVAALNPLNTEPGKGFRRNGFMMLRGLSLTLAPLCPRPPVLDPIFFLNFQNIFVKNKLNVTHSKMRSL